MTNWQLSKQGIRWPVSPDRIEGSGVTSYQFSNDRRLKFIFLKIHSKYVVFMLLWPALWRFWFQTDLGRENSASYLNIQADWSTFDMWLHAPPEADRVLCQLVMFLTAFFHWMNKMKYSCYQESSAFHGWFVYWVFWLRNASLIKVRNPISDEQWML